MSTSVTVANPMRGSFNSAEIISATSARIWSANRSARCPGAAIETYTFCKFLARREGASAALGRNPKTKFSLPIADCRLTIEKSEEFHEMIRHVLTQDFF
jgi:hypothetical protein